MELQNLFGRKGLFPWNWITPRPKQGPPTPLHPTPPQNHTYGQYFQKKLSTWIDSNV